MKTLLSFMFYRISQHSTFLYLMNPKFTKVGIIEDQLIDSIYPAGTIYQKLGHRDGAFFSDSKMRTSFHPRLQQCLDRISVQEWYFYHRNLRLINSYWTRLFIFHWMKWVMIYENIIKSVWIRMKLFWSYSRCLRSLWPHTYCTDFAKDSTKIFKTKK